MTVGGVEVGVKLGQIEVNVTRHVGAIDDAEDAGFAGTFDELCNRENDRGR